MSGSSLALLALAWFRKLREEAAVFFPMRTWHSALLAVLVVASGLAVHRLMTNERLRQIDQGLEAHALQHGVTTQAGTNPCGSK